MIFHAEDSCSPLPAYAAGGVPVFPRFSPKHPQSRATKNTPQEEIRKDVTSLNTRPGRFYGSFKTFV